MGGMVGLLDGRVIFTSNYGYIGVGPKQLQSEDLICVLLGADVPFVLHEGPPQCYQLIDECYVHGMMDGEVMEGNPSLEEFILH